MSSALPATTFETPRPGVTFRFSTFDLGTRHFLKRYEADSLAAANDQCGPSESWIFGDWEAELYYCDPNCLPALIGDGGPGDPGAPRPPVLEPAEPVTPAMIKAECERRILERYPVTRQLNLIDAGGDELVAMRTFRDAMRRASNRLEAMNPPPLDHTDDTHWRETDG